MSADLESVRIELTRRISLLLLASAALGAWVILPLAPFPTTTLLLLLGTSALALLVLLLLRYWPYSAAPALVLGAAGLLMTGMWFFPSATLPSLASLIVLISALLNPVSGYISTPLLGVWTWWLAGQGYRDYDVALNLIVLLSSAVLGIVVRTVLFSVLEWMWSAQQRADVLLAETRQHRAELSSAFKSAQITNDVLLRIERELVAARRQAESSQRMKEQFAANISHELRTPLNLILGFSEIMYMSPEVYGEMEWPTALRRDVSQIHQNSRHLFGLINDILDLSRFEIVGFSLDREPAAVPVLVEETIQIISDLYRRARLQLEVDVEDGLPLLELDRVRIRQVLINLLDNAQRFAAGGKVWLRVRALAGEVEFRIIDTGPGLAPEVLERVFDDFFQVDRSLRRNQGGTGLGLAISKRFVLAHGGRIWAESAPGEGTTFVFVLPIPDAPPPIAELKLSGAVDYSVRGHEPCLLLVDSDESSATFIRRQIPNMQVVQVGELQQVAPAVDRFEPQAVLVNASRYLETDPRLAIDRDVPVIYCSFASGRWVSEALAVRGMLTKPITSAQLLDAIRRVGGVEDILMLDDERGFQQLVARYLAAAGSRATVRHAYTGADGLAAMRARKPDLLLLDLVMPEVDGLEVLQVMREDATLAGIPVLVITASDYGKEMPARLQSRFVVSRRGGLRTTELLQYARAVLDLSVAR